MKKRSLSLLLALALALCLGLAAPTALAAESPAVSRNARRQDQISLSASPITSYIFENEAAGLTRVEYIDGQIMVEDYSSDFIFQSGRTIPMELSIWGGFFAGADYNFFVFGQQNADEDDSVEVIRVVKYSKDWERLGQASLHGANTTVPFDFGSLRCAEYEGELYIRTCHEMYTSDDGLNHQANLTLCVDQDSMDVLDSYYRVMNSSVGYVSHSFNQFVLVDQDGTIVTMDHGDAYPRAAVLMKYQTKAGNGAFSGRVGETTIQTFADQEIYQFTGASLGGLAETGNGYVAAYNYDSTGSGSSANRTTYLAYVPKRSNTASVKPVFSAGATTPQLVSTGLSGGYMLWNGKQDKIVTDTLYYASYDSEGNVGTVQTALGLLSDCAPICYNSQVVWYVTDNAAPVFYTLDESGVTRHDGQKPPKPDGTQQPQEIMFTDVPATHWACSYVAEMAALGAVQGVGNGQFAPDRSVSSAEFSTMLSKLFFAGELSAYQGEPYYWWESCADILLNAGALDGTTARMYYEKGIWDREIMETSMTRYDMAQVMYNILRAKGVEMPDAAGVQSAAGQIADYSSIPETYANAVTAMYAMGCLSGVDDIGTFAGDSPMSRAAACAVLCRLLEEI